jgi:tetratricopeptide (TPR) repeat protein
MTGSTTEEKTMVSRIAAPVILLLLGATVATADAVAVKDRRGKITWIGIKKEIDEVPITLQNIDLYLDQSTGEIVKDGYAEVHVKPKAGGKQVKIVPRDQVAVVKFSGEPEDLLAGFDNIAAGAMGAALSDFRAVKENKELREVFRIEAYFRIGLIYIQRNAHKSAIKWLSEWPYPDSVYTPQVNQRLALLYTHYRQFGKARAEYEKIERLARITQAWTYKAKLGGVQVDLAERKWPQAEQGASAIAGKVGGNDLLKNEAVLARTLQSMAIINSGKKDRVPEAEALLQKASGIEPVEPQFRALLFVTLGDALYAQGKLEEARFPYMRVACLYPEQRAQVAHALQNVGQIYLDMSEWKRNKEVEGRSDDLFVKGMRQLYECASRHRGTGAAVAAAKTYRQHKKRYEALTVGAEEEKPEGG